jgi:hypothetical protein
MPPLRNALTASPEKMNILAGALHRRRMDIAVVGVCPRRSEDERKSMTQADIRLSFFYVHEDRKFLEPTS